MPPEPGLPGGRLTKERRTSELRIASAAPETADSSSRPQGGSPRGNQGFPRASRRSMSTSRSWNQPRRSRCRRSHQSERPTIAMPDQQDADVGPGDREPQDRGGCVGGPADESVFLDEVPQRDGNVHAPSNRGREHHRPEAPRRRSLARGAPLGSRGHERIAAARPATFVRRRAGRSSAAGAARIHAAARRDAAGRRPARVRAAAAASRAARRLRRSQALAADRLLPPPPADPPFLLAVRLGVRDLLLA